MAIRDNRDAIAAAAREAFGRRSSHSWKEPGNKYDHGIRVAKLAERLRLAICPDDPTVHPEVLEAAAWFHDLCNGQDHHEEAGAAAVPALIGAYCTPEELTEICNLIRVHDHRTITPEKIYPPSVLILQDADMLDHLGTYDIWITFSEFSHQHRTPYDYAKQFREEDGAFRRFALRWRRKINYPYSLTIFDEKIAFEEEFARRMLRELDGEFC